MKHLEQSSMLSISGSFLAVITGDSGGSEMILENHTLGWFSRLIFTRLKFMAELLGGSVHIPKDPWGCTVSHQEADLSLHAHRIQTQPFSPLGPLPTVPCASSIHPPFVIDWSQKRIAMVSLSEGKIISHSQDKWKCYCVCCLDWSHNLPAASQNDSSW